MSEKKCAVCLKDNYLNGICPECGDKELLVKPNSEKEERMRIVKARRDYLNLNAASFADLLDFRINSVYHNEKNTCSKQYWKRTADIMALPKSRITKVDVDDIIKVNVNGEDLETAVTTIHFREDGIKYFFYDQDGKARFTFREDFDLVRTVTNTQKDYYYKTRKNRNKAKGE